MVATIHSPPPYTFLLFDRILLLQKGNTVYFGPNGDAVVDYFEQTFAELRHIRRAEGIADFLLDVTTRANGRAEEAALLVEGYAKSQLCAANQLVIEVREPKRGFCFRRYIVKTYLRCYLACKCCRARRESKKPILRLIWKLGDPPAPWLRSMACLRPRQR